MTEPVLARQTSTQPTNKLAIGTTVSGGIAAVVAGVMSAYGGPAIQEMLANVPWMGPETKNLVIMLVAGIMGYLATKYGGQTSAYNVLDKPNVRIEDKK